jgi:hypothetical protein
MQMATFEQLNASLDRFSGNEFTVVEHRPPSELVSPTDLIRVDELGRKYIACPAGQPPHSELQLTDKERSALVEPAPSLPKGHMTPVGFGFSPSGVVKGEYPSGV